MRFGNVRNLALLFRNSAWSILVPLQDKSLHAAERGTEGNRKQREEFAAHIATIPPERPIFLDEGGVTTSITRLCARRQDGRGIYEATPGGRCRIMTVPGAMSLRGMVATMTIADATDAEILRAYVERVLCPALPPISVVVMDNPSSHTVTGVRERIEIRGTEVLYLPPTRPA